MYSPNKVAPAIFGVLFGISTVGHIWQCMYGHTADTHNESDTLHQSLQCLENDRTTSHVRCLLHGWLRPSRIRRVQLSILSKQPQRLHRQSGHDIHLPVRESCLWLITNANILHVVHCSSWPTTMCWEECCASFLIAHLFLPIASCRYSVLWSPSSKLSMV